MYYILIKFTYNMGSNMRHTMLARIAIIILIVSCVTCLKHGGKSQSQTASQSDKTSPSTKPTSDKSSTASTSIQKSTNQDKKETKTEGKDQKKEQPKKQTENSKTQKDKEEKQKKEEETDDKLQFKIKAAENQYVVPIQIGQDKYNFGLYYGQQKEPYGKMPSWMFTSLTETHSLCDAASDCQEVTKFVKCETGKKKESPLCVDDGKAKYNDEILQSKKKAKITYKINDQTRTCSFVSPSKATLNFQQIAENQISGVLNLAMANDKKFTDCLVLKDNTLTVLNQEEFKSELQNKDILDLNKTGFFSLTDNKDLYLRTKNKEGKISSNLKSSYEKIKIGFNRVDVLMAVTKEMMVAIKNILKKEYFGDRCKIKDYQVACSAAPIQNITKLSLCRDKDGKNCINLQILGMVLREVKANKTYQLLIEQNKSDEEEKTLIFYPKLAEHYQIYASSGLIKGAYPLKQSENQKNINAAKEDKQEKQQKQQQSKKSQQEAQQKQKKQDQDQEEQKSKDQKSQTKAKPHDEPQQQKQQKEVVKEKSKKNKQQKSEQKSQQEDQKDQKEEKDEKSEKQQEKDSAEEVKQTSKKGKNKVKKAKEQEKQNDEDNQEKDSQQKQQQNKKSGKKKSPKHIQSQLAQKGSIEQEQKYSKGILFFTFLYGSVFIVAIVVIKWKAKQSVAAAAIDRFLEVTWYAIVKNYFTRSQGYNPPVDEDEGKGNEQVDRSDSVAVGYSYKQGKELFWQNNSIEGF